VVVPEPVELVVQPVDLVLHLGIELGGEAVPELCPLFAQALDLGVDLSEGVHALLNVVPRRSIPQE
jgi:hypothetical protein